MIKEIPNGDRAPKVKRNTVSVESDLTVARMNARNADIRKACERSLVTFKPVTKEVALMIMDGVLPMESAKFFGLVEIV
tara:strand:- start:312 stop:548 length:237 start_codon:yes stop_codon:yes gene_type:complete